MLGSGRCFFPRALQRKYLLQTPCDVRKDIQSINAQPNPVTLTVPQNKGLQGRKKGVIVVTFKVCVPFPVVLYLNIKFEYSSTVRCYKIFEGEITGYKIMIYILFSLLVIVFAALSYL